MDPKEAVRFARLWQAGKMVGADTDEVVSGLLKAFDAAIEDLQATWQHEHDEFCTNTEDCESFGGDKPCHSPKPDSLSFNTLPDSAEDRAERTGKPSERQRGPDEGNATCGVCGYELEAVRPGHHQCNFCGSGTR